MIVFTRLEGLGSPPWHEETPQRVRVWDYFWLNGDIDRPEWFPLATVACGNGHLASIDPKVHSIAADGMLSPSYVCPRKDCTFHEFVRLDGWNGR